MKLHKFLPLIAMGALLVACGGGNGGSSSSSSDTSIDDEKTVAVKFYIDYNHADESNPYMEYAWYEGKILPEVPADPACPDPAFPVFLGWSDHSLIDDVSQLWDFSKDTARIGQYYLPLFGIWAAVGE